MKSVKITSEAIPGKSRWYDDACGTALGLELLGERWTLLILREMMFGGRRFSELRAGLPGISANVLTQRLERMEAVGILTRRRLPPPASVQLYELTPWGLEAEGIVQEMGRWATRSPLHDPRLPLSSASLMMSFRTMLSRERAGDARMAIGFCFGEEGFVGRIGDGAFTATREEPDEGCVASFATDPMTLAGVVYGGMPLAEAQAGGALTLSGSRAAAERFVRLFPLPPKWTGSP